MITVQMGEILFPPAVNITLRDATAEQAVEVWHQVAVALRCRARVLGHEQSAVSDALIMIAYHLDDMVEKGGMTRD